MALVFASTLAIAPVSAAAAGEDGFAAERQLAELLFGRAHDDPCLERTGGISRCPVKLGDHRISVSDEHSDQVFTIEDNRCTIHAHTTERPSGRMFDATFRLYNVDTVVQGLVRVRGDVTDYAFYLKGPDVVTYGGRDSAVLEFKRRYREKPKDGRPELKKVKDSLKAYRDQFCPAGI